VLRREGGKLKEWTEYTDSALVNAVLGDPRETLVEPAGARFRLILLTHGVRRRKFQKCTNLFTETGPLEDSAAI
jgi:hypothetical protein